MQTVSEMIIFPLGKHTKVKNKQTKTAVMLSNSNHKMMIITIITFIEGPFMA